MAPGICIQLLRPALAVIRQEIGSTLKYSSNGTD